jgi:hypothetical protein
MRHRQISYGDHGGGAQDRIDAALRFRSGGTWDLRRGETRNHFSAKDSFREAVFDVLHDAIVDEEDRTRLLDTFEVLLAHKPQGRGQVCPYDHLGCNRHIAISNGTSDCPCEKKRPVYSTDALRIHERFSPDEGTNGEAFGLVSEVWGKVLLVHLLRCFERQSMLDKLEKLAFVMDGHRAVLIHPFQNGNGRWARMLANIWLKQSGQKIIAWPDQAIENASVIRQTYIQAVKAADNGDYLPLIALHQNFGK